MSTTLSLPREAIAAVSGIMFGVGWLILVDGNVYENLVIHKQRIEFWYYVPGIIATVALFMTNIVNLEALNPYSWLFEDGVSTRIRAWLFLSFVLNFGAITASIWLLVAKFHTDDQWPGIAMVLQSVILFISSLLLMWAKSDKGDTDYNTF